MAEQLSTPSFDSWTSLFLLVSSLGFFLTILLASSKRHRTSNLPIALITLGLSLILVQYVFFWTNYQSLYPYVYCFDTTWYYAFGPLLYWYILKFYSNTHRLHILHFLPTAIVGLLSAYYLVQTVGFTQTETFTESALFRLHWRLRNPWLPALSCWIYLLWLHDFVLRSKPVENHSQAEQLRHTWANYLLRSFALFLFAYVSYYVLVNFPFFNPTWDYAISLTMSIGIYGIGIMVYKEPSIFNGELLSALFQSKTKTNGIVAEKTKNELYKKLQHYMQENKPFLENGLRLVQLADELGFSTHLLSQIINEKSNKNFNQFINDYRLREVEQLLINEPKLSIKTAYFNAGFNNKVTFYNAFKKKHNCTPIAYRKALQKRKVL